MMNLLKQGFGFIDQQRSQYHKRRVRQKLEQQFGQQVANYSPYEIDSLLLIQQVLQRLPTPISIVYEIGANDGTWAEMFALNTKNLVYAFEPLPILAPSIQLRQARNTLIQFVPMACGEVSSRLKIHQHNFPASSSLLSSTSNLYNVWTHVKEIDALEVEVIAIDEWRKQNKILPPSLMKIDVQGYELQVLNGAQETLKQTSFVWIEMNFANLYEGGSHFSDVYEFLTKHNFRLIDLIEPIRDPKTDRLQYIDAMFQRIQS
jgi:FkbM family methyltransferase